MTSSEIKMQFDNLVQSECASSGYNGISSGSNTISELDAAKALLDLRGQIFHFNAGGIWTRETEEIEEPSTASKLFNRLYTITPKRHKYESADQNTEETPAKTTREWETQTDVRNRLPEIEEMDTVIKGLFKRLEVLQSQVGSKVLKVDSTAETAATSDNRSETDSRKTYKRKRKISDFDVTPSYRKYRKSDFQSKISNTRTKNFSKTIGELVPIGDGNAVVPATLLKNMDWTSYTNSSRKLLTAVFPRNVLATHSLTGKRSPAFPNKAAKKKLEPALVNDIVQTVMERCKVPENFVRTSITTKCSDESKRVRNGNSKKKKLRP
ncbi:unnamed protein product [Leptosia nina]|uniref:BEN domain-containing protein n=1 Tax=Leptosia nina TaxID=320188 RepID=A0AAV1JND6_9NEOP